MKVNPITPSEIGVRLPNLMIEEVNELIKDRFDGRKAIISINTICRIKGYKPGDMELLADLYKKFGWNTEIDQTGDYNALVFKV